MKIFIFYDLKLKTDPNRILSKNFIANKLIMFIYKFVKSVTKIKSKMQKLKSYNKVINNLIYKNKKYKAIDKRL